MPYSEAIPGDPWVQCDRCGFRYRMSQTRRTWDGLRVCDKDWEPKHPLLNIRAKIDRQAVHDARPESPDRFVEIYSFGTFCLQAPNGGNHIVSMLDGGTLTTTPGTLGPPVLFLPIGDYLLTVDNSGTLNTPVPALTPGPPAWQIHSPDNTAYRITIPGDTITVSAW